MSTLYKTRIFIILDEEHTEWQEAAIILTQWYFQDCSFQLQGVDILRNTGKWKISVNTCISKTFIILYAYILIEHS